MARSKVIKKKKPAYEPPASGTECYVCKSYKEWSSSTRVTILKMVDADTALVRHFPTKKSFEIDMDYLVRRRRVKDQITNA